METNTATCQQCFQEYDPSAAIFDDGFCSDSCHDQYQAELVGEEQDEEE